MVFPWENLADFVENLGILGGDRSADGGIGTADVTTTQW